MRQRPLYLSCSRCMSDRRVFSSFSVSIKYFLVLWTCFLAFVFFCRMLVRLVIKMGLGLRLPPTRGHLVILCFFSYHICICTFFSWSSCAQLNTCFSSLHPTLYYLSILLSITRTTLKSLYLISLFPLPRMQVYPLLQLPSCSVCTHVWAERGNIE